MFNILKKIILALAMLMFTVVGLVGVMYIQDNKNREINIERSVTFQIEQGESLNSIAGKMKEEGIIRYPKLFMLYGKINGLTGDVKYGMYLLNEAMMYKDIYRTISDSTLSEEIYTKFTVPEGFTVKQIAKKLEEEGIGSEAVFLDEAKRGDFEYWFLEDVPFYEDGYRLEGFLFPETYHLERGVSERDIIDKMLSEFEKRVEGYQKKYSSKEFYDIIKMASIVERETYIKNEKDIVAGVFYNRLNNGIKLESCATVEYVLNTRKKVLSYEDISIDSEYNTYKFNGLPPTPISNPGIESIVATIEYKETDYMFFVANSDGTGHIFSKSYEEHLSNIDKYR